MVRSQSPLLLGDKFKSTPDILTNTFFCNVFISFFQKFNPVRLLLNLNFYQWQALDSCNYSQLRWCKNYRCDLFAIGWSLKFATT
jgi:hypothetical protein